MHVNKSRHAETISSESFNKQVLLSRAELGCKPGELPASFAN